MGSLKEVGRLVNGLSLVVKEYVNRSQALKAARNGDLQNLIKKAIVSSTDLSGLTKGETRRLSHATSSIPDSVVYFNSTSTTTTTTTDSDSSSEATPVAFQQEQEQQQQQLQHPTSFHARNDTSNRVGEAASSSSAAENLDIEYGLGLVEEAQEDKGIDSKVACKGRKPRERRVPSTPFARALGFAGLGAGLQESARRLVFGSPSQNKQSALSPFLSEQNAERLALALCRMRGAALKIGQMLNIQDDSLVPPPLTLLRRFTSFQLQPPLTSKLYCENLDSTRSKIEMTIIQPLIAMLISSLIAIRAYRRKSLDLSGALSGFVVMTIHIALGYRYGALLVVFFFTSSKLTKIGEEKKRCVDADFKEGGQRNWIQVLSYSGIATVLVVVIWKLTGWEDKCLDPKDSTLLTSLLGGITGHYSCCDEDPWSSELGVINDAQPSGESFFNHYVYNSNCRGMLCTISAHSRS